MPTSYKIIVTQGQTLFDIAMQYLGSAEHVVKVAMINNIEVTANLNTGDELDIPVIELTSSEEKVIQNFVNKTTKPAGANPA